MIFLYLRIRSMNNILLFCEFDRLIILFNTIFMKYYPFEQKFIWFIIGLLKSKIEKRRILSAFSNCYFTQYSWNIILVSKYSFFYSWIWLWIRSINNILFFCEFDWLIMLFTHELNFVTTYIVSLLLLIYTWT